MPTKNLTAAFVEAVKPPARGQVPYWDEKVTNFGLRVSQGGKKTWVIFYRAKRGTVPPGTRRPAHLIKIGTYPPLSLADARDLAKLELAKAQKGDDPAAEKQAAKAEAAKAAEARGMTFGELAELYLERHAKVHKRSWHSDELNIRRELLPSWGSRKAADITRAEVIALLDAIKDRGAGIMANRMQPLISKIYNWGIDEAKAGLQVNPALRVAPRVPKNDRERVLTPAELRTFWRALDGEGMVGEVFRVLLLTGQRVGEVRGMRWDEIDLDTGWWTIPGSRTKNKKLHRVPLVGEALGIVRARGENREGELVFPSPRNGGRRPVAQLNRPFARIAGEGADFTPHDFRRTVSTGMAELGVDDKVIEKVLNHSDGSVAGIYNRHTYAAEKTAALTRWDRRVREIVKDGVSDKVVRLHA